MKYNKAEIMKRAWELKKDWHCKALTFGECLARAWSEAKRVMENAKELAAKAKFVSGMQLTLDGYTRTLIRWTKGSLDRVYINGGSRKGDGFVDIVNKIAHVSNTSYASKMAEAILAMEF